ncbi:hypothetical protein RHGRI_018185 [Rhododendron griersonianum]|uniref:Uncharacterized protein n=1 Tax=Rhododendron griersonianum TaxID=479676 RepID=A0AAV6K0J3_9ERIC|nr:hypothetical protein RHGRI_018185 [Rhododendron griersonianum]
MTAQNKEKRKRTNWIRAAIGTPPTSAPLLPLPENPKKQHRHSLFCVFTPLFGRYFQWLGRPWDVCLETLTGCLFRDLDPSKWKGTFVKINKINPFLHVSQDQCVYQLDIGHSPVMS